MTKLKVRDKFKSIVDGFKSLDRDELYLLAVVASLFAPFFITGIAIFLYCVYICTDKALISKTFKSKYGYILIAFCVITLIVSICHKRLVGVAVSVGMFLIVLFFMSCTVTLTRKIYNKALDICCAMSVWCFLYALVQKLVMGMSYRSTAGLLNANYYATMIEFVIFICVYRIITRPDAYKRYIIIIAINVVALFLCDCQSAWLPIIIGVLSLLYFNGYKKHTAFFVSASVLLGIFLIAVPGILPRLDRMPQTIQTRVNIWDTAIKGIRQFPLFGQGPMSYFSTQERFGGYWTYHAHSIYLDPLLCFGIVGMLLMVTYIFLTARKMANSNYGKDSVAIKSLIFATFLAIMVHGFTDYTLFWMQTGTMFCFIISAAFMKSTPIIHPKERISKQTN